MLGWNSRKQLMEQIYQNNVEKGFWTEDRNQGEALMLIVCELAEAVEAHRKRDYPDYERYEIIKSQEDYGFITAFEDFIKDTVYDELADAWIRCADCIYGFFGEDINSSFFDPSNDDLLDTSDNFAEQCLSIVEIFGTSQWVLSDIVHVMEAIETLCVEREIDLLWHIKQKLDYNKQRPYKHGKQY